ncbi:hydrolase [Fredinandcohnia quinoae]|uniref:Hydrolase n=1 Tax=Fredinandcohnia quinoae TaxID=2918902 RepID=A0AAW5E9I6_9BACI|nr:hydrolase [Fredinandcohnia sp. SECRCQ15]
MVGQPKKTYYIAVGSGEISQVKSASSYEYKIEATDDEINQLRSLFTNNYGNEIGTFVRAHIPFREYHHDPDNDAYDGTMQKVFQMIYDLGDEEAREHIRSEGILE